jgi:ADP-heptose:LPS heptosyltransferase
VNPQVLVLRALGLGDFLSGVPALRALRRALPEHRLVLAAPEALRPLVELSHSVDELLATGELEPVPWVGPPPAVAVDLHGNGPASKRLLEALHPERLVAFAGPGGDGRHVDGPAWDPDEHERRRWCRLVQHAFDVAGDPDDIGLAVPGREAEVPGAVVMHVGAASASRRWPEDRFAAVARAAADRDHRVVLTGSIPELPLMERVREAAGLPLTAVARGTDLQDLAALVARAELVLCGDTGVAHLASAYATPSVVLFGPTPPHRWGPPEDGPHDVLWHGTGVGDPHDDEPDPALLRITVDEVLARVAVRLGWPSEEHPLPAAQRSSRPSA